MLILYLLVATQLLAPVRSRVFETKLPFTVFRHNGGWIFLDKMTFERGKAEFRLETWLDGTPGQTLQPLSVWLVKDDDWPHEQKHQCTSQLNKTFEHHFQTSNNEPAITDYSIDLQEQHTYYIVFKDCEKSYAKEYANPGLRLRVQLTMLNNGSHLSTDEDDDWLIMPLAFAVAVWLTFRTRKEIVKGEEVDWAKAVLLLSIVLNFCALLVKFIGWVIYAKSGIDYGVLSILYLVCHSFSESLVIGLLILLSFGWTISFLSGEDMQVYTPMAIVIACLNCVTSIMNKLNDDSHDKYHMYDSLPGGLMVGMRVLALGTFLIGAGITWSKSSKDKRIFLWKFISCSLAYLSSMPLLLLVCELAIDEKQRKEFMFIMVQLTKVLTSIFLTYMITSDRSHYNKINLRTYSFLPSSGKLF